MMQRAGRWRRGAVGALALGLCGPAWAGPLVDLATEAEASAAAGRPLDAYEALHRAMVTLTANGPLLLRKSLFVAEPPKGFGIYQPRRGSSFPKGEPLIVYAEPVGMAWRPVDGRLESTIVVDFEIRSPAGQILAGQRDFGRFSFNSLERNQEIMAQLTITLTGAPAGSYVLGTTFRDTVSGKSATADLPFKIE